MLIDSVYIYIFLSIDRKDDPKETLGPSKNLIHMLFIKMKEFIKLYKSGKQKEKTEKKSLILRPW